MIPVVIADDEAMIRAGVRAILASDPELAVVGEAGDGGAAVELVRAHRPRVALLDVRMPRLDGLTAAAELRRLVPETAVVLLTTFGEDDYIARALGAGVSGFLLKAGDPRELLAGIRAAAGGGACLSPSVARRVIELNGARMGRSPAARLRTAGADLAGGFQAVLAGRQRLADRPAPLVTAALLAAEAQLRTANGDLDGARNLLVPAAQTAAGATASIAVELARVELLAGDPGAATRALVGGSASLSRWGVPDGEAGPGVPVEGAVCLELGRRPGPAGASGWPASSAAAGPHAANVRPGRSAR